MSDFEEKLNSVLSNPDAMSQIMNLAQSLNLGGGGGESPQGGQGGGNEPPPPPPPSHLAPRHDKLQHDSPVRTP